MLDCCSYSIHVQLREEVRQANRMIARAERAMKYSSVAHELMRPCHEGSRTQHGRLPARVASPTVPELPASELQAQDELLRAWRIARVLRDEIVHGRNPMIERVALRIEGPWDCRRGGRWSRCQDQRARCWRWHDRQQDAAGRHEAASRPMVADAPRRHVGVNTVHQNSSGSLSVFKYLHPVVGRDASISIVHNELRTRLTWDAHILNPCRARTAFCEKCHIIDAFFTPKRSQ